MQLLAAREDAGAPAMRIIIKGIDPASGLPDRSLCQRVARRQRPAKGCR